MKRIIILFCLTLFYGYSIGQSQVKASIGFGDCASCVKVYVTSPVTVDPLPLVLIGNLQFDIAIPNTVNPIPTLSFVNTPGTLGTGWAPILPTYEEAGYIHYVWTPGDQGSIPFSATANVEKFVVQFQFSTPGLPGNGDVFLMYLGDCPIFDLDSGGGCGDMNFNGLSQAIYAFEADTIMTGPPRVCTSTLPGQEFFYPRNDNDGVHFTTVVNNLSITDDDSSFAKLQSGPLPVSIVDFQAANVNNTAKLTLKVQNEDANTKEYQVERSSDGVSFTKVATYAADVQPNGSNTYTFSNLSLDGGNKYFRVKQEDKDGQFVYTKVGFVKYNGGKGSLSVFPNPVTDGTLKVAAELKKAGAVTVVITSKDGKVVSSKQFSGNAGSNVFPVNLNVARGSYDVKVIAEETKVFSVVKQ